MLGDDALSIMVLLGLTGGALGCYTFAWYSWRVTDHPIADRFALVMVADGSWALFSLFGHVSPTDALALAWRPPVVVAATFAAAFWFRFVVDYTADTDSLPTWLTRAVMTQPVLFVPLALGNPGGLVFVGRGVDTFGYIAVPYLAFGPLMLANSLYTFALLLVAFAFLSRFLLRSRNLFRKQAAVILAVNLVIVVSSMVFVGGLAPERNLDVTPILFAVNALGTGVALFRYDFLDVEPMAAHTLLEEIDDPVLVLTTTGTLVDWNRAADDHVGTDAGHGSVEDISIPELSAALTATDGGAALGTTTVTAPAPDGARGRVTYDVRTTPIEDRYDITRGLAVVLRDITEQEQRKRALETQNERLEEFTGVVSHDLRNPLQVIDSRIELARQTGDLDHLEGASDATRRMGELLDDLLKLAREGQVLDETSDVALADCVERAWASIAASAATLSVETDRVVVADAVRLRQVFENLFRNSIEHGGADVTITVGGTDEGFYVADDGPGVPDDEREAIFDLGMTSSADGTGFGLAIVERIVDAHGWSIDVTESDAGGARFEVSLADRELPAVDE